MRSPEPPVRTRAISRPTGSDRDVRRRRRRRPRRRARASRPVRGLGDESDLSEKKICTDPKKRLEKSVSLRRMGTSATSRAPCDACASRAARVYCAADDAKFCLRCDRAVRADRGRDGANTSRTRARASDGAGAGGRILKLTTRATVDDARTQVHGANKFAERHSRRWLCEWCARACAEVRVDLEGTGRSLTVRAGPSDRLGGRRGGDATDASTTLTCEG